MYACTPGSPRGRGSPAKYTLEAHLQDVEARLVAPDGGDLARAHAVVVGQRAVGVALQQQCPHHVRVALGARQPQRRLAVPGNTRPVGQRISTKPSAEGALLRTCDGARGRHGTEPGPQRKQGRLPCCLL